MAAQRSQDNTPLLTAVAMTAAMLMIAQHIAGKATRDALFLTYFDVARLPLMMMVSAGISVAAVLLMSHLLTRFGPARLIPPLYLLSALLLMAQWYLSDTLPTVAAVALYLHVSALNSILISGFWSVINERFDPYAAKKVIAKLTAAATFGGLLGGVAAKVVASAADTHAILLMMCVMHLICGGCVALLARGQQQGAQQAKASSNLLAPLKRSPLIRSMAFLAVLVATTAAVLDYILKAEASAALSHDELISFFSYFYMAVGFGSFLVQSMVGNRALRWLGLGGSMAAWPLVILATGGIALLARSLITATLMRASANLLYNSFFRAGFELLYTPIAPADKRAGKVLIDVGADRSGDLLGGLLVMGILLVPVATEGILLGMALILAGICLAVILVLYRRYVHQLADNLRDGSPRRETAAPVAASTTLHTLAEPQAMIERGALLQEIAKYREHSTSVPPDEAAFPFGAVDAVTEAIMALRSGDETRIRRVLASQRLNAELVPHVIPLLKEEGVLMEALTALRRTATTGAGQLVDALLDPMQPSVVRRRLPLVLAHSESRLAVEGLSAGLDDPDWNVRFRCAKGLEVIRRYRPHLRASEERLLSAAEREALSIAAENKPSSRLIVNETSASSSPERWQKKRLELLFLLFGALYQPETLELCHDALESEDPGLRGTALEYLENLLPAHIWALLQPVLAPGRPKSGKKRSTPQQAATALISAAASLKPRKKPRPSSTRTTAQPARGGETTTVPPEQRA